MPQIILETPRLILREVDARDADDFYILDSDPEVARYTGRKPVASVERCQEVIRFIQQQYADYGIGRWAVVLRASGEFLGWSGLKRMSELEVNGRRDFIDIGYRFQRRHWGQGYATEAARAVLAYGFETQHFAEICAFAVKENVASCHVLRKIGMTPSNEFPFDGETCLWFSAENPMGIAPAGTAEAET